VGRKIKAVVAVYHDPGLQPKIISPCGRCRELITDYAKDGYVILRDPGTRKTFKVKSGELLPFKYADYWHHRELL
jgi:cytidine deaminase